MSHHRLRPELEGLEERLALSQAAAAVPATAPALLAGVGGVVTSVPSGDTITVLNEFAQSYRSHIGQPNYNPAFDLNHNGQIGQADAKLLLRALPAVAPKTRIAITVGLAPQDQVHAHVPANLGGVTYDKTPTIVGHTSPGALIFIGTGTVDVKLTGPVAVADAQGNFSFQMTNTDGINQLDLQAVDRYGQQILRAYPILWLGFAKYEAAHPKNT